MDRMQQRRSAAHVALLATLLALVCLACAGPGAGRLAARLRADRARLRAAGARRSELLRAGARARSRPRSRSAGGAPARRPPGVGRIRPGRRPDPEAARKRLRVQRRSRRRRTDGGGRGRLRRSGDRRRPRKIQQGIRTSALHGCKAAASEGQPARLELAALAPRRRQIGLVGRDLARRRDGPLRLPEMPHPARGGQQRADDEPRRRGQEGRRNGRRRRVELLRRARAGRPGRGRTGAVRTPRHGDRRRHRATTATTGGRARRSNRRGPTPNRPTCRRPTRAWCRSAARRSR